MGLETVHPEVLARLNKGMTLDRFRRAAEFLSREGISLRAFVLVGLPFLSEEESLHWACRSVEFAFDCGASVVSLIPTRAGNGALDALAERGEFSPPGLAAVEDALAFGLSLERGRVLADLWDLERLRRCARCFEPRAERLRAMNLTQSAPAAGALRLVFAASMNGSFDIAVIGSGFAGSLFAIVCRRLGRSVVLVERGTHPRFAIGESSSPLANLLLEELCDRYGLSRIRPLSAWGSWQRQYPGNRMRLEARLHVLRPSAWTPVRRRSRETRSAPGRGEPARRGRRHALVSRGLRRLPGRRGPGRGGRVLRLDAARLDPSRRGRIRSRGRTPRPARRAPRAVRR